MRINFISCVGNRWFKRIRVLLRQSSVSLASCSLLIDFNTATFTKTLLLSLFGPLSIDSISCKGARHDDDKEHEGDDSLPEPNVFVTENEQ